MARKPKEPFLQAAALPRLLLSAPASGGGKTTVTCGLLRALKNRGLEPMACKCGPDYIDPMFHSEITGTKSRNLDLFFLGAEETRRLLWEGGRSTDLTIIEGVMGYYDGIGLSSDSGAYDLSQVTCTPTVLVVDGRGAALSLVALIKGFLDFRSNSGIKGIILNRVSPMLYPRLKALIEAETWIPVYGFLPQRPDCALESRHLGLVTATEVECLEEKLDCLAALAEEYLDIDGLLELADAAPPLALEDAPNLEPVAGTKIAVARDKAFCFYYADGLRLLRSLGAELVEFSPLSDGGLPPGCNGLYLGGGYPELYTETLSQNETMRQAIREAVVDGMPCVAECGGFLYLHDTLEDQSGTAYPMAGVIHAHATRTERLGPFGYVTLTAQVDSLLCQKGECLPAHEFHYWASGDPGQDFSAQKPQSERQWSCVHATPTMYAGFPHFHFCARPQAARRFVAACADYGTK